MACVVCIFNRVKLGWPVYFNVVVFWLPKAKKKQYIFVLKQSFGTNNFLNLFCDCVCVCNVNLKWYLVVRNWL